MSAPDLLFAVRNNFYLGAYQHAISEASDLENLDDAEKLERDMFVYRSYIELGSYEVSIGTLWSSRLWPQTEERRRYLSHKASHVWDGQSA